MVGEIFVAIPYEAGLGLSLAEDPVRLNVDGVAIPYEAGLGLSQGSVMRISSSPEGRNPL